MVWEEAWALEVQRPRPPTQPPGPPVKPLQGLGSTSLSVPLLPAGGQADKTLQEAGLERRSWGLREKPTLAWSGTVAGISQARLTPPVAMSVNHWVVPEVAQEC